MIRRLWVEQRGFVQGSAIGGAISFAVFAIILTATSGHFDLLRSDPFGNFFDAQARALMHGRWNVPATELSFEGIRRGSNTYTYFGLWPSLLRMPVIAIFPSLYGRLTQLSMLFAFAVFLWALAELQWLIRTFVRPNRACGGFEAAAVIIAIAVGSSALFMASRPIVYNEAILWGIALSSLAYSRIMRLIRRQTAQALLIACLTSLLALLSRPSVGLGPVVALAIVAVAQLLRAVPVTRRRNWLTHLDWLGADGPAPRRRSRWIAGWIASVAIPIVVYASINFARFNSAFSIPWNHYVEYGYNAQFRIALNQNNGSFFGTKFLPTTVLQYLRPDAISLSPLFPWLTFPAHRATIVGHVALIARTMSTSISASMPALSLLCILGIVTAIWPRLVGERNVAILRAPLVGGVVGTLPVLGAAYIGNRYLGDFVPLLVVGSLAGLHTLLKWLDRAREQLDAIHRMILTFVMAIIGLLAVFGLWANVSLALVYQRLADPVTLQQRTEMVSLQYRVDALFGGSPRDVVFASKLPRRVSRPFTTVVVGSCNSVYWSDGETWWELEGRPESGVFQLHVVFPKALQSAGWEPILSTGPSDQLVVGVRRAKNSYEFGIGYRNLSGNLGFIPGIEYRAVRAADVEVVVSNVRHEISVLLDGTDVADLPIPPMSSVVPYQLGAESFGGITHSFTGKVTSLPPQLALCRELQRRSSHH